MLPDSFDIQGHRGARGLYPENTIPGFRAALDFGVTTLEMDVVISKDRRVVVSHDPWIAAAICLQPDGRRIPYLRERRLRIYEMTYREIAAYDCGSLRHPRFRKQRNIRAAKPLLADVVNAAERHVHDTSREPVFYSIETKTRPDWDGIYHPDPDTFARLLLDVLEAGGIVERAIVQSFDVRTLQSVKRIDPSVRLSLLVDRKKVQGLEGNLDALGFVPAIYSPHHARVDRALVERARGRGLDVIPWTVNDVERMLYLRDLGVGGLITDYPDVAVRELRS